MTPETLRIYEAALALSEEERDDLLEALLEIQGGPESLRFRDEWAAEAEARWSEYLAGKVTPVDAADVIARARERFKKPPAE